MPNDARPWECRCSCHEPGDVTMHFMPCCSVCPTCKRRVVAQREEERLHAAECAHEENEARHVTGNQQEGTVLLVPLHPRSALESQ